MVVLERSQTPGFLEGPVHELQSEAMAVMMAGTATIFGLFN